MSWEPVRLRTLVVRPLVFAFAAILCLAGCKKQDGEAIVLAKEHIAAAEPDAGSPRAESVEKEKTLRPIEDDEITVDQSVMKPEVRGTSRDPRALANEQWLVKVRMVENGRIFNVPATRTQFEKLKGGDRTRVKYRLGKYTGTVWAAEIDGK